MPALRGRYARWGSYRASASDYKRIDCDVPGSTMVESFFGMKMTSGSNNVQYHRMDWEGVASGGSGLRVYSVIKAAVNTVNNAHFTAEMSTSGTCTGLVAALRATLAATQATGSGGTLAALQLDSDMSVTPANTAAFLRVIDNGASKMPYLFNVIAATTGCLAAAGTTFTPAGGLKVLVNGAAVHVPFGAVSS
mgnify:CR=1 FL=1